MTRFFWYENDVLSKYFVITPTIVVFLEF